MGNFGRLVECGGQATGGRDGSGCDDTSTLHDNDEAKECASSPSVSPGGRDHASGSAATGAGAARGSSPDAVTTTSLTGLSPRAVGVLSIFLTTSIPSTMLPNTTCLPFSHGVAVVVMKNCDPLVLGPALAMERTPGPTWLSLSRGKASSGNLRP